MERTEPVDDPPSGGSFALEAVLPWLEQARDLGFLGPGPVEPHISHALGFVETAGTAPDQLVDLGTGGGLPGLVLLAVWPETKGVLLDSNRRRIDLVAQAVAALGWEGRVTVMLARAEEAGRDAAFRGRWSLVVSRGFGPPPVVAECAAPLLRVGGRLLVSEPPVDDASAPRWPADGLQQLGLVPDRVATTPGGRFQVLSQVSPCPESYPRRVGIPAKRPLW